MATHTLLKRCASLLVIPAALFANAPVITDVVNIASPEGGFSPGALATLRYSGLTHFDSDSDRVEVGGRSAPAHDNETGDELTFEVPEDLPVGPSTVVLFTAAGSSQPFPIKLQKYAPAIFPPTRSLNDPYDQTFNCKSLAIPGETLTLFAVGVGPVSLAANANPPPVVMVGGLPAVVTEAAPADFPGFGFNFGKDVFRIRFVVPQGEGQRLVTLFFGDGVSNDVALPIGKAMLSVSSATFSPGPSAPDSIETAYQCSGPAFIPGLDVLVATPPDLPLSLGGVSVIVQDYLGVSRRAPIYAVTRYQVNYVVPAETSPFVAAISIVTSDGQVVEGDLHIRSVAPALFPAVQVVRLHAGVQTFESGLPISMGPASDEVYRVMYGSGFRHRSSLENVRALIGGVEVPVQYAGAQGGAPGLDQLNLHLPASLAGRGDVKLDLTIDGQHAQASLSFK